jgi:uncharacterized protein (TIGR02145 family)
MKKPGLLIFTIMVYSFLNAQNYKISFTGSGSSNITEHVKVKNLTRNTFLTIDGNDILHLVGQLTSEPIIELDEQLKIYPNPSAGITKARFHTSSSENVRIDIFDISGTALYTSIQKISPGLNEVEITGIRKGIHLIKISSSTWTVTEKIVSDNKSQNEIKLKHTYIGPEHAIRKSTFESNKNEVQMLYKEGERLLFRGISGNYARILTYIPTQNEVIDFNYIPCTDPDNNYYAVVTIGNQIWMADNLNTSKYSNGDAIAHLKNDNDWKTTNNGAWSYYNNDESYAAHYGKLYNWHTVIDPRNLCPTGWRVPSNVDWDILRTHLDPTSIDNTNSAGGKMKDTGTVLAKTGLWKHPNTGATNESGFIGNPAGSRAGSTGAFDFIGQFAIWWSTTPGNESNSWCHALHYQFTRLSLQYNGNRNGLSVRCIKD